MDEGPDQIAEHIRSTRSELTDNLRELEHKVKDATNWRVQFERHPVAFLGAAFVGGILLSASLGGRRRAGTYDRERWSGSQAAPSRATWHENSAATEIWNKIKGGLVAAAGSQISNILGELIPTSRGQDKHAASVRPAGRPQGSSLGANGGPKNEEANEGATHAPTDGPQGNERLI